MTTRSQARSAMAHILEVVFALQADSPLHKALNENGYVTPEDFVMELDSNIDSLEYTDDKSNPVVIPKGMAGLLKTFKQFVSYQNSLNQQIVDWSTVTRDEFNAFRILNANNPSPITPAFVPSSIARPPAPIDLVRDFKRGIKCDPSQFTPLKDDSAWDNWNRSTLAQARAQDLAEVLDPGYVPTTTEDIALFTKKQKFMFA